MCDFIKHRNNIIFSPTPRFISSCTQPHVPVGTDVMLNAFGSKIEFSKQTASEALTTPENSESSTQPTTSRPTTTSKLGDELVRDPAIKLIMTRTKIFRFNWMILFLFFGPELISIIYV